MSTRPAPRIWIGLAVVCSLAVALAGCAAGDDGETAVTVASAAPTVGPRDVDDETTASGPIVTASSTAPTSSTRPAPARPVTACAAEGSAVGAAGTDPAGGGAVPPARATITVWHYLHDRAADELEAGVAAYQEAHPGVEVVLVPFASMRAELDTWSSTDPADRPDLLLASDDAIGVLAASPDLVPFDGCLADGGELLPVVEATYTIDDHLVAAPYLVSTPLLFFDAGAFERAGLDPADPPTSLADLRTALESLVTSGVAPAGIALETGGQSGGSWYVEQWLARLGIESMVADNGRRPGEPATSVNWSTPDAVDGIEFLAGLVADGLATVVDDTSGSADLLRMVSTDPAAMAVQSSASIGEVLDVLDQGAFGGIELGVGPLPGPGRGGLVGGAALWMAADRDPGHRAAALDLVRHLTSAEVQAGLASRTGYVPVRAASLGEPVLVEAFEERPQLRVAVEQLQGMPEEPASLVPVSTVRTELRTVLGDAVTAVLAGGADPQAALDLATEAAAALLARA